MTGSTRRTAPGFTLVELLVVVGILAVLIAILVPALATARELARQTACRSNLKHIATANHLFAEDNQGRLVPHARFNRDLPNLNGTTGVNQEWCWADQFAGPPETAFTNGLLAPYLDGSSTIAGCPSMTISEAALKRARERNLAQPLLVAYGYNGLLLGEKHPNFAAGSPAITGFRSWRGYRLSQIPRASQVAMFADSAQVVAETLFNAKDILPPLSVRFPDGSPRANAAPSIHGRHRRLANVAFVDTHVNAEHVMIYDNQDSTTKSYNIGFLDPNDDQQRDNERMTVQRE